ncbi:MAG: DUF2461 domain-containing protein [Pseudomonadota bacterium]
MSDAQFTGFSPAGLNFLSGLASHNHRDWFEEHRPQYEQGLLEPAKDLVAELGAALGQAVPGLVVDPRVNRGLFRMRRDTRFAGDKSPYKTHLGLWWWEGLGGRMEGSGFYFHLEPPNLMLAVGIYQFTPPVLAAFRAAAADLKRGQALARLVAQAQAQGFGIGGAHYRRLPRGVPADHPNAELLKHNGLHAFRWEPMPEAVHSPELVDWCLERFLPLVGLHDWLAQTARQAE